MWDILVAAILLRCQYRAGPSRSKNFRQSSWALLAERSERVKALRRV